MVNPWLTSHSTFKSLQLLDTFIQHSFGSPGHSNQRRKIIGVQIGKVIKLSLFVNDMILYIENPKDATRKLPGFIDKFAKAARYKRNMQKSVTFLYTKNKVSEKEIKETIPFTIRNQRSNCQHPLYRQKSKRVPEKPPFLLYRLCQSL